MTDHPEAADLTRPIIGINNRTPLEVFDIMCDRFTRAMQAAMPAPAGVRVKADEGEQG